MNQQTQQLVPDTGIHFEDVQGNIAKKAISAIIRVRGIQISQ